TTTSIRPFAVERTQTTPEELGCFCRCQKRWRFDVRCGLACHGQTKPGVARQFMPGRIVAKCSNQSCMSRCFVTPAIEGSMDSRVRDPARLCQTSINQSQAGAHELF